MRKYLNLLNAIILVIILAPSASAQLMIEQGKVVIRANPGETVVNTITVHNTSRDISLHLRAYWEDFVYVAPYDKGDKDFTAAGTGPYSASRFVNFSPQEFTLKPLEKNKVSYSVQMPASAKGGYYGTLFLEEAGGKPSGRIGVSLVTRIGSLFFIESTNSKKTAVIDNHQVNGNEITADFTNTGDVIMIPDSTDYIMDKEGMVADRGDISKFYLPPGKKTPFKITLKKDLPAGTYTSVSTFDLGDGDTITDELDFAKAADGKITLLPKASPYTVK